MVCLRKRGLTLNGPSSYVYSWCLNADGKLSLRCMHSCSCGTGVQISRHYRVLRTIAIQHLQEMWSFIKEKESHGFVYMKILLCLWTTCKISLSAILGCFNPMKPKWAWGLKLLCVAVYLLRMSNQLYIFKHLKFLV